MGLVAHAVALLVAPSHALLRTPGVAPSCARGVSPRRVTTARTRPVHLDFSFFEKSFTDELYKEERLEKNAALFDLYRALPSFGSLGKCNAKEIRQGIDEAREAGATVAELKPYVEALQKIDPSLVTETDEAVLRGAEQVVVASAPRPARPPPDSYLTEEQFEALREASKSQERPAEPCAEALMGLFGQPDTFFALLRNPKVEPGPEAWAAVRAAWPALEGMPDDELQKNLVACRQERVDPRFL